MNKRVVVGMSGGVDSSVAAYLLKEDGYDVIGVLIKLRKEQNFENNHISSFSSDVEDARRVCSILNIPFHLVDLSEIFEKEIITYFIDEYFNGRTPNPCIMCNMKIKFEALLKKAIELDAYYIATGHYGKVFYSKDYDRFMLKKSITFQKDQTYALYRLTQNQLKHLLLPLGDYTKDKTREIALTLGLNVAKKTDSQEICFISDKDYRRFLTEKRAKDITSGNFIDKYGNILGKHNGIIHYTIGQRKGLGICCENPMFVSEILPQENLVVLGTNSDIFKSELIASNPSFIPFERLKTSINITAKIRYNAKEADAKLVPLEKNKVKVIFNDPQRAITPGQSVVFYDKDILIGGAIIEK